MLLKMTVRTDSNCSSQDSKEDLEANISMGPLWWPLPEFVSEFVSDSMTQINISD